jgi:hypothetical protein
MKRTIALIAVAFICLSSLAALEVKDGLMKVVLFEDSGRFGVYYLSDVAKGTYVPLLFDRDPRTSSLNLLVDGKLYRMGESADFRIGFRRNGTGADFIFKSSFCTLTQNFSFVKSAGASLSDGVAVTITFENASEKDEYAGLRLILDTYLGEGGTSHFSSNLRQRVTGETRLDARSKDEWIASVEEGKTGLAVPLSTADAVRPDAIVLANWSRLDSAAWDFEYNQTRNFTLQPYSINDSAIAMDWDATVIQRAKSRSVAFILSGFKGGVPGAYEKGALQAAASDSSASAASGKPFVAPSGSAQATGQGTLASVQTDYMVVDDLLKRLNAALQPDASLSTADIDAMRKVLEELKAKKAQY